MVVFTSTPWEVVVYIQRLVHEPVGELVLLSPDGRVAHLPDLAAEACRLE